MSSSLLTLSALAALVLTPPIEVPVELGLVAWQRDFSAALSQADEDHKPVLLLFQEVPG